MGMGLEGAIKYRMSRFIIYYPALPFPFFFFFFFMSPDVYRVYIWFFSDFNVSLSEDELNPDEEI